MAHRPSMISSAIATPFSEIFAGGHNLAFRRADRPIPTPSGRPNRSPTQGLVILACSITRSLIVSWRRRPKLRQYKTRCNGAAEEQIIVSSCIPDSFCIANSMLLWKKTELEAALADVLRSTRVPQSLSTSSAPAIFRFAGRAIQHGHCHASKGRPTRLHGGLPSDAKPCRVHDSAGAPLCLLMSVLIHRHRRHL